MSGFDCGSLSIRHGHAQSLKWAAVTGLLPAFNSKPRDVSPDAVTDVRSKSRQWEEMERRRLPLPLANKKGGQIDGAIRCIGMQAVANGSGGGI